jgi:hypothetical protein
MGKRLHFDAQHFAEAFDIAALVDFLLYRMVCLVFGAALPKANLTK